MKLWKKIGLGIGFALVACAIYVNQKYEVFAFHPFFGSDDADLKVMTWNVHCPNGADSVRQHRIAEMILQEGADFVLLNEFYQDSCQALDSMLRARYAYTEEYQSHRICGDIFYSKLKLHNSGHPVLRDVWKSRFAKEGEEYPDSLKQYIYSSIKATLSVGTDSLFIVGCHLISNNGGGSGTVDNIDSLKLIDQKFERYKEKQKRRTFDAKWLGELIMDNSHPAILMGDMNDFNCSAPLDTLVNAGLTDAWWEGGTGYGCTFHSGWMRLRIDHILHSDGLQLTGVRVIPTDLSDHNPVVACFKIKK